MLLPKLPFARSWFLTELEAQTPLCCGQVPVATRHGVAICKGVLVSITLFAQNLFAKILKADVYIQLLLSSS